MYYLAMKPAFPIGDELHTATTGFAGISTDAALPLPKAASVLSRVCRQFKMLHE